MSFANDPNLNKALNDSSGDAKDNQFMKTALTGGEYKSIFGETNYLKFKTLAENFYKSFSVVNKGGDKNELLKHFVELKKFAKGSQGKAFHDVRSTYLAAKHIMKENFGFTKEQLKIDETEDR